MAQTFSFKLVTPAGIVCEAQVESVTAIGPLGEFGVLADHINFITSLNPGVLTIKLDATHYRHYVVPDGLAEVKDGAMTVLASEAPPAENFERGAAADEVEAAAERLRNMSFYQVEYQDAERALQLAQARAYAAELHQPHR